MKRLALIFALALAGCVSGGNNAPTALWRDYNGTPLTINGSLFSFNWPTVSPGVNYEMTNAPQNISGTLNAAWSISASAGTTFDYRTNPDNTCVSAATAGLYIQKQYDDWQSKGFRYTSVARTTLISGNAGLSASLDDPSQWIDMIDGTSATTQPAAFAAAKAMAATWGIVFGGGCFAGHGVFVDPPGQATFTMTQFGAN